MEEDSTLVRIAAYSIGIISVAVSWFADFSYLEIRHTNGFVEECSGFDVIAIICGVIAMLCSVAARSIILAIGGMSAIGIGLNFNDALCPEFVSPTLFWNFP